MGRANVTTSNGKHPLRVGFMVKAAGLVCQLAQGGTLESGAVERLKGYRDLPVGVGSGQWLGRARAQSHLYLG